MNRYREHEFAGHFYKDNPEKIADEQERKSYSTQGAYDG
jgi:hypothetical protein